MPNFISNIFTGLQRTASVSSNDNLSKLLALTNKASKNSVLTTTKVQSDGCARLQFKKKSSRTRKDCNAMQATMHRLLANSIREVQSIIPTADLTHSASVLNQSIQEFMTPGSERISAGAMQTILAQVGAAITTSAYKALGASSFQREAPRTPTECLTDWMSFLTSAKCIQADTYLKEAKALWLENSITSRSVISLLKSTTESGNQKEAAGIREKAGALIRQLPADAKTAPFTRLHDNPYGRVFDSSLVRNLVQNPPEAALKATHDASLYLAEQLENMQKSDAIEAAARTRMAACNDPRFWTAAKPELDEFITSGSNQEALQRLVTMLQTAPQDGGDIILRQYLAVKLCLSIGTVSRRTAPWMNAADKNYHDVISPESGRLASRGPKDSDLLPTAGITPAHLPPALARSWMSHSSRPSVKYRPDFEKPSASTSMALEAGLPYAGGISGSTNIMLHLGAHMKQSEGLNIDMRHLLLSTLMFLNYDGGHSVHEVLWVGHQLDKPLGLELGLDQGLAPLEYLGNTVQLMNTFKDCSSREYLNTAKDEAFKETLDYFRKHSFYASSVDNAVTQ